MKNLDSLILAHNQLTSVPANVFRHLTLLSSLELEGNNIAYVDKDAFAGLEGGYSLIVDNKSKSTLLYTTFKRNTYKRSTQTLIPSMPSNPYWCYVTSHHIL